LTPTNLTLIEINSQNRAEMKYNAREKYGSAGKNTIACVGMYITRAYLAECMWLNFLHLAHYCTQLFL
jgi:hypothetical protein